MFSSYPLFSHALVDCYLQWAPWMEIGGAIVWAIHSVYLDLHVLISLRMKYQVASG